jgi:hypothetical protein
MLTNIFFDCYNLFLAKKIHKNNIVTNKFYKNTKTSGRFLGYD